jgi:hypothetical protein
MCSLELSLYLLIIKMKHFFCPGSRLFLFCCNEINLVSFITLTPSTFLPLNPRFIRIIIIYVLINKKKLVRKFSTFVLFFETLVTPKLRCLIFMRIIWPASLCLWIPFAAIFSSYWHSRSFLSGTLYCWVFLTLCYPALTNLHSTVRSWWVILLFTLVSFASFSMFIPS